MAQKPVLVAPIVTVIMDDGSVFEDVQATNYDMLSMERYARAHKWPPVQDMPMETSTFIAWHAVNREGLIPGIDYETFALRAISVETKRATADPTDAGPGDD